MKSMLLLSFAVVFATTGGQIYLELDPVFSPPATQPADPRDYIYSAPELDHMLQPIIVMVKHSNNNSFVMENVQIIATTIKDGNENENGNPGDWYDGELCRHSFWFNRFWYNRYYMDGGIELHCNNTDPSYPLGKVPVLSENGLAEFPRLVHTKYFNESRRIRFFATHNGYSANITTNAVTVDLQAVGLNITSPIPSFVYVNEPMTVTVQTMARDPNTGALIPLTTGRHSTLHVDLTVSWEHKSFYRFFPSSANFNEIYYSNVTLASVDAFVNGFYDIMIRKRCSGGTATFTDVRIQNIYSGVTLNVTQILPYDPWERWPPVYNDTIEDFNSLFFRIRDDPLLSPGVAISDPFDVIASEIDSLYITPASLVSFGSSIDANFPLKPDLMIEAHDTEGRRITDGPDSTLNVTVEIDPASACLSTDSDFQLTYGNGTFPGSVCAPSENVRLRFSVVATNGTTIYSNWTPQFNVSGVLRFAGIFPQYYGSALPIMFEAAKTLINRGTWHKAFVDEGRQLVHERYMSPTGTVQETLEIYERINDKNQDLTQPSIRAIVGSVENEQTVALSKVAKLHKMPVIGYTADDAELSDKVYNIIERYWLDLSIQTTHPYFNRLSIPERMKYVAIGSFLASHHWNRIIVIKDSGHPIPAIMYQGFELYGVQIVLEVTIPIVTITDYSNIPPLDDEYQQILNAGTTIIYSYTFPPADVYLYHEAIRLQFAPIYGYQWLTEYTIYLAFPYINNVGLCSQHPHCTTAFNSTIIVNPGFIADLQGDFWNKTLFDAYTHLDPIPTPGATLYRWPSTLGFISLVHDATVATYLGARRIMERNETITGPKLATEIRLVNFIGGTGNISFDANGDRPDFAATLFQIKPWFDDIVFINDYVFEAGAYNIDPVTSEFVQILAWQRSLSIGFYNDTIAYTPSNYTNIRRFRGYWQGQTDEIMFEMHVPAAYYCPDGCGGGLSNDSNGTIYYYNHGTCIAQDTCQCKTKVGTLEPGYAGRTCSQPLCDPQCRNGQCTSPDNCVCDQGWTGIDCSTPICAPVCDHGTCTGPNTCDCEAGYWGQSCSNQCTCKNGVCNDGQGGTGTCSTCNGAWTGADCDVSIPLVVVPTMTVSILVVVAIILIVIWYIRRMRFQAALANNDWIANYDDIIILQDDKGAASSMAFRSMISMKSNQKKQKNVIRNQGKWKDIAVAIKMINKESVGPINTQMRLEVKKMRDLRHVNVASFVGACCDSPNICVLMEVAPKGSLDDLLANETLNLDWNFKYSLLKDICRGMVYLSNSSIKSHGRLKSSNCVVDNRWTLKITDYGMHSFKANQQGVPKFNASEPIAEKVQFVEDVEDGYNNYITKQALLFTAPEILATGVTHPDHVGCGTIQGDVYSMAMITYEIITKEPAFNEFMDFMEIDEILDCIAGRRPTPQQVWQHKGKREEYLRPTLPDDPESTGLCKLTQECWSQDPMERPTFDAILKSLNQLSPQQGDLMDNLVNMLEKYSTNLEAIVAERTAELAAEKQKTEDLVCRMLPKAIAEQLKHGQPVSAESFECVTIYFSDIVGFTSIAGDSNPLQVVDLLNDLYTCFDAIIDHYDVYKVETIGDAYMVVSGLPIRNGDNHAGEIASMSLHLLSAILDFRIRHMPDRKLQLRIGMHSGPAVAGVVGLKMPRYCLFGDTVNTASRMESGGLALRIHMSESTAEILEKLGGYHLQSRGQREVKGKGIMTTYWLTGKDGFNRPLPTEDMAVSESKHEFK